MAWLRGVGLVVMAGVLSGCATLGREECLNADWHLIGYEDGSAGKLPEQVGEHRQACAEHAVVPDMDAYLLGRSQGLVNYCTEENGYRLGSKGASFNPVCSRQGKANFMQGYRAGKELYQQQQLVERLESRLQRLKKHLVELRKLKYERRTELLAENTSSVRRYELYQWIDELDEKIGASEQRAFDVQHKLSDERNYLNVLQDEHGKYY